MVAILKGSPELFYLRGSTRTDAIVFALVLAFVPPLVIVAFERLARAALRELRAVVLIVNSLPSAWSLF